MPLSYSDPTVGLFNAWSERSRRRLRELQSEAAASHAARTLGSIMASLPEANPVRRELAEAIRDALDRYGQVTLGPTDGEMAADALDGIPADTEDDSPA